MGTVVIGSGAVGRAVAAGIRQRGGEPLALPLRPMGASQGAAHTCGFADIWAVVDDPAVDVVVDTTHGEGAVPILVRALQNGKAVVSANARGMAAHGSELEALARDSGAPLLYDASAGAAGAALRAIDDLRPAGIYRLQGTLDVFSNFVLSRVEQGDTFAEARTCAQRLGSRHKGVGYDPTDTDSADTLAILARRAFGDVGQGGLVETLGIGWMTPDDFATARDGGMSWRLVATAARHGCLRVEPMLLPRDHPLVPHTGITTVVVSTERRGAVRVTGEAPGREATVATILRDVEHATAAASERFQHV